MALQIRTLEVFDKQAKRLNRKYKRLGADLRQLKAILQNDPAAGIELGKGCYKIRLANSSVPTGKSGGFRVIYYYLDRDSNLYLMSIYSKTEQSSTSEARLLAILQGAGLTE